MLILLLLTISYTASSKETFYKGTITINVGEEKTLYQTLDGVYVASWFIRQKVGMGSTDFQENWCLKIVSQDSYKCTIKGVAAEDEGIHEIHCISKDQQQECYWKVIVKAPGYIYVDANPDGGYSFSPKKVSRGTKVYLTARVNDTTVSDAKIYYTTDGSTPSQKSKLYTSAGITINEWTYLQAIAYKDSYSPVTSGWYYDIEEPIPVTEIILNKTSLSLNETQEETLKATVRPDNATDKTVTWSSSNTSVATVSSSGLVTAKAAGAATITCKANDGSGKYATCKVTVTDVGPNKIDLWISTTVHLNETQKLIPTITPAEATTKLTWASSNTSIATVDQQGVVTGKALGTARITVTTDNGKSDYCDIKVVKTFTAKTAEGVTMTFQILDEANKTCQAGEDPTQKDYSSYQVTTWAVPYGTSGQLSIPSTAGGYTVTDIGGLAFINLGNITSVSIPNTVKSIGKYAFQGCSSIETMTIPNSVTEIEKYAFSQCTKLSSIVLPNSITILNDGLFWEDTSLKTVAIPSSVEKIGWSVFSDSGLEEITIPASVKSIGWYAFQKCPNLKKVTSMILDPTAFSLYDNVFQNEDGTFTSATLYAPFGTKSLYEKESGWNKFSSIIEMSAPDPENILRSEDVTVSKGRSAIMNINLTNKTTDFTGYQFDLKLPAGITLAKNDKGKLLVTKTARYEDSEQTLQVSLVEGTNIYRFVSFSLENGGIKETSGSILNVTIAVDADVEPKTYEAEISDIIFTRKDGTQHKLQTTKFNIVVNNVIPGDANGDGEVNVSDIVEIVNDIMGKPSAKFVKAAADVNGDGEVNVTDIVQVVNIIMAKGGAGSRGMYEMASTGTDNAQLTLAADGNGGLSLCLDNDGGYVASQFDVRLSDGQTIDDISLNSERSERHLLTYSKTADNIYKVVVYSLDNSTYSGHSGELFNIHVSGSGSIEVDNIVFVTNDFQENRFPPLFVGTTGVENINHSTLSSEHRYDLQGRKTRASKKGIHIVNGKKQVVR